MVYLRIKKQACLRERGIIQRIPQIFQRQLADSKIGRGINYRITDNYPRVCVTNLARQIV